jgi:hypothetical protein
LTLYRAEATRTHAGRNTRWEGKWRKDPTQALAQAQRWRTKEPFARIYVAQRGGPKATLEDLIEAMGR